MPKNPFLSAPKLLNMGFHYTEQYSLRTRVKVVGLVDHASPDWRSWYLDCHTRPALQKCVRRAMTSWRFIIFTDRLERREQGNRAHQENG